MVLESDFRRNFWLYISRSERSGPTLGAISVFEHVYYVAFNSNPTDSQVGTRYAGRRGRALLAMLCAMLVGLAWVLSTSAILRHKTRK